jgi:8-oxo-dGTP pyrophosphatase MutT (NUDIX family)
MCGASRQSNNPDEPINRLHLVDSVASNFESRTVHVDALGNLVPHDGSSPVTWRVSAYVLAIRDMKILLVDHPWANRWELPGGEVKVTETLVEGAVRECWEETGYWFRPMRSRPSYVDEQFFYRRGKRTYHHSLVLVFEGAIDGGPDPTWQPQAGEISRVEWINPGALTLDNTFAFHWPALQQLGVVG